MTKWICPICGDKELTIECPHNTKDVFVAAAIYRQLINHVLIALAIMQTDCGPAAVMAGETIAYINSVIIGE